MQKLIILIVFTLLTGCAVNYTTEPTEPRFETVTSLLGTVDTKDIQDRREADWFERQIPKTDHNPTTP